MGEGGGHPAFPARGVGVEVASNEMRILKITGLAQQTANLPQAHRFQRMIQVRHPKGERVLQSFDGDVREKHGALLGAGQAR